MGLASYDEASVEAGYKFCGRQRATLELFSKVDNNVLTTLYGKSGVGKTSLVQAGLFPKLRANGYLPVIVRLGLHDDAYSEILKDAVSEAAESENYSCISHDEPKRPDDEMFLWHFFKTTEFRSDDGQILFPVIVLDQFEELFFKNQEALIILLKQLHVLTDDSSVDYEDSYSEYTNYRVLISLREDELFRLEDYIDRLRIPEMKNNRYRLLELNHDDAENIVREPGYGLWRPDDIKKIADVLIAHVKSEDGEISTAMLSLVCSRLYESVAASGNCPVSADVVEAFLKCSDSDFITSFYNEIKARIQVPAEWYYIEDELLTDDGRRKAVLESEFRRHVSSADFLFEGEFAMLRYVAAGTQKERQVEIIHDAFAKSIMASRLERQLNEAASKQRRRNRIVAGMAVIAFLIIAFIGLQYYRVKRAEEELLKTESWYLTTEADELMTDGNFSKALRLLLYALPENSDKGRRPFVREAGMALLKLDMCQSQDRWARFAHDGRVNYVDFSQDERYIATASADSTARIWDVMTGKPVTVLKHGGRVNTAEFSPSDGLLLTSSSDGWARIWDLKTKVVVDSLKHEADVRSASYSHDGTLVLTASFDSTASIWNVECDDIKSVSLGGIGVGAEFSSHGNSFLTYSSDNIVRVWSSATGKEISKEMRHPEHIRSARFSNLSDMILTSSDDGVVRVWEVGTGNLLSDKIRHKKPVTYAEFSPDGKYIVSSSNDNTARVWDAETGLPIFPESGSDMGNHKSHVYHAEFSPDGRYVLTASYDGTMIIWDVSTGKQAAETMALSDKISHAGFSDNGKYMYAVSLNNAVSVWKERIYGRHERGWNLVKYSPADDRFAAYSSPDGTIRIWDVVSGRPVGKSMKHNSIVVSMEFSHDGRYLLTSSRDSSARVWDVFSGEPVSPRLCHGRTLSDAVFFPADTDIIVTASSDSLMKVWNFRQGKESDILIHESSVLDVDVSSDGNYIASVTRDGILHIFDCRNRVRDTLCGHAGTINSVSFCPMTEQSGRSLVTASADSTVRIWNMTDKCVADTLKHEGKAIYATYSNDGRYVATVSGDNMVCIWEPATDLTKKYRCDTYVEHVAFSPDSKHILIVSGNTMIILEAATGDEIISPLEFWHPLYHADFNHTGTSIAVAGRDGYVNVMPFTGLEELLKKYSAHELDMSLTEEEKSEYHLKN